MNGEGHKSPNCPGFWINISTLNTPCFYMCSECRGTRRTKPEDDPLPEPTDQDYEGDGGFTMLGWTLIALSAVVVIGVLLWIVL